jgi:hypothetical protein
MTQLTAYQYAKLGSNLEFLRGISTASIMQTTSLAGFPNLMANLPAQRFSVVRVVEGIRAVLIQLQEMGLQQALQAAEGFRPMLKEMEDYLGRAKSPEHAHLNDRFAEQLVALSKQVASLVRKELSASSPSAPSTTA